MQKETLVPGSISEEELIRLVDTYSGVLLGLCRLTLGDTAMAQDIVQETFLKAWKKGGFRQGRYGQNTARRFIYTCHSCFSPRRFSPYEETALQAGHGSYNSFRPPPG